MSVRTHRRSSGLWSTAVLLSLTLVGSACDNDPLRPEQKALDAAQARWTATRPASNTYVIRQTVQCFCANGGVAFVVTVTNGAITRVRNPLTSADLPETQYSQFRTIDQLFSALRSALQTKGALKMAEYDATYGYPTEMSLDPLPNAVDDEYAVSTRDFSTGI
jgi:hypothetical protein